MRAIVCVVGAMACGASTGCSDREAEPLGRGLTVKVAPLSYPQLDRVVYDLGVYTMVAGDPKANSNYELVWEQQDVDSVQYGDGIGAITYIGPCDAQDQADGWPDNCLNPSDCDAAGEKAGWVVIDIDSIAANGSPINQTEWVNPCTSFGFGATDDPTTADCVLAVLCEENADVLVEFNLTLMRAADQGFFDIIVEFEDIFCSAKFDTCYNDVAATPDVDEAGWIQLLHKDTDDNGVGDTRWDTGVLAFACTGGPGADTNLYFDDVSIVCERQGTIKLDPSQDEGGNVAAPADQSIVFGYATYFGREDLDCGDEQPLSCKKKYWNMSIGFDTDANHRLPESCTLYASATASDGMFDGNWATPSRTRYPIVRFSIPLTGERNLLTCGNWGLDEIDDAFVYTEYTSLACVADETGEFASGGSDDCDFCHHANGVDPENSTRSECGTGAAAGACSTPCKPLECPDGTITNVCHEDLTPCCPGSVVVSNLCGVVGTGCRASHLPPPCPVGEVRSCNAATNEFECCVAPPPTVCMPQSFADGRNCPSLLCAPGELPGCTGPGDSIGLSCCYREPDPVSEFP